MTIVTDNYCHWKLRHRFYGRISKKWELGDFISCVLIANFFAFFDQGIDVSVIRKMPENGYVFWAIILQDG